jgi:hypothetical protein
MSATSSFSNAAGTPLLTGAQETWAEERAQKVT